jgi:hypothetical protein
MILIDYLRLLFNGSVLSDLFEYDEEDEEDIDNLILRVV